MVNPMKRLLLFILFSSMAYAVGTCTITGPTQLGSSPVLINVSPTLLLSVACTADAANGSYPATALPQLIESPQMQGMALLRAEIAPGSPNPTAGFSVSITDANGVDQLTGQAINLSASTAAIYSAGAGIPVNGTFTLNITGNSVNSAVVTTTMYFGPVTAVTAAKQVAEKGSRWALTSQPAVSTQATVSRAAGTGTTRHVADCVTFSGMATTAPAAAAQIQINLRDGATGAGTVIWSHQLFIAASASQLVTPFSVCGLAEQGSSATAMTLEFSAAVTNLFESVTLSGYDVQ